MADIFERLIKNYGPIGQHRERAHGYFAFPKLEGEIASKMKFRGQEMIVWSLNNYLGLANHPEVRKADAEGSAQYGLALPMGARMMSGNSDLHEQLERELAEFVHKEDSILMNYGYQGIMSAIDAICGRHDVVVYDAECHACIIDALRMIPGHRFVFKHNDVEDCEKQLLRAQALVDKQQSGGVLVITEGVFGMAGDQGKLKEIAALKKKVPFRLLVDDAHGFGTLGATGAGAGVCITGFSITGSGFGAGGGVFTTGATGAGALGVADPASPIIAMTPPTGITESCAALISNKTPATGEGISVSTLSVETSTMASSTLITSPTFFNQRVTVPSVTDSPS